MAFVRLFQAPACYCCDNMSHSNEGPTMIGLTRRARPTPGSKVLTDGKCALGSSALLLLSSLR